MPASRLQRTFVRLHKPDFAELDKRFERSEFDPWMPVDEAPRNATLREATGQFLTSRKHLRSSTQERYASVMRTLTDAAPPNLRVRDVTEEHLRPVVYDETVKVATPAFRYRHMRAAFNWWSKKGLIPDSPLDEIHRPKAGVAVPEFLTPADLQRLLRCIDADVELKAREGLVQEGEALWLTDLVLQAVNTGCRICELANIRWSDVDFHSGFVSIRNRDADTDTGFQRKGKSERVIPLAGDALDVLRRRQAEREDHTDGYVITGVTGGQLNTQYASKRFKYYVRLAKLPERSKFHSIRDACASWLAMTGVPLQVIQAILGHSSVQVTQKYAHLTPDVLTAAMQKTFGGAQ